MSLVQLACPNRDCGRYAEKVLVGADASHGHVTLRDEVDGRCDACDTERQPYETVLLAEDQS